MPEELKKANVLLRVVSKALDILLIAAAWELLPKAGFFAGLFYILISDGLIQGRSLGKKVIGLQVISLSSKTPCSVRDSILRNLPLALGFLALKIPFIGWIICGAVGLLELILIIGSEDGLRLGDMLAHTTVVVRDEKSEDKQVNKLASLEGQS